MAIRGLVSVLILTGLCLSSGDPGGAAPNAAKKLDYSWWRLASSDARAAAVRAAMDAGQVGWLLGYSQAQGDISRAIVASNAGDAALRALYHTPISGGPVYPEPVEYYVLAVDALYAKHPPLRKYEVGGIVLTCLPSNAVKSDCERLLKEG